ncbi:unnamed protein product (mitochondrion) [Plasmodiophora brassicae]|uniref:S phase cyclin A-associated protein in the endoplasmic reticulum N-terminal domain-containing protein n=2 Tax=Plasmodiophora brassicae TaxID=37360 RepID=A0A3P3YII8_PLABS|nr:unnamed protein product [Plasmodiophora brassicae]
MPATVTVATSSAPRVPVGRCDDHDELGVRRVLRGARQRLLAAADAEQCRAVIGIVRDGLADLEQVLETITTAADADDRARSPEPVLWSDVVSCGSPPGAQAPVTASRSRASSLRKKFSSPERRRLSSVDAKRKQDDKQAKAEFARKALDEERKKRAEMQSERIRQVLQEQDRRLAQTKLTLQLKTMKADELREVKVGEIRKKAEAENLKVREVTFINRMSTANMMQELMERQDHAAQRKLEHLAARAGKVRTDADVTAKAPTTASSAAHPGDAPASVAPSRSQRRKAKRLRKSLLRSQETEGAANSANDGNAAVAGSPERLLPAQAAPSSVSPADAAAIAKVPVFRLLFREASASGIPEFSEFSEPGNQSAGDLVLRVRHVHKAISTPSKLASIAPEALSALANQLPVVLRAAHALGVLDDSGLQTVMRLLQTLHRIPSVSDASLESAAMLPFVDFMVALGKSTPLGSSRIHDRGLELLVGVVSATTSSSNQKASLVRYISLSGLLHQLSSCLSESSRPGWRDEMQCVLPNIMSLLFALSASAVCTNDPVYDVRRQPHPILHVFETTVIPALVTVLGSLTVENPHGGIGNDAKQDPLPANVIASLTTAVSTINNVAWLDLRAIQAMALQFSAEMHHILSCLIAYAAKFCEADEATMRLLQEVVLFIGYVSLRNEATQESLRWGNPSILQRLCGLPFRFVVDKAAKDILLPTLIAASFQNPINADLLARFRFSTGHLAAYIRDKQGAAAAGRGDASPPVLRLVNRFPGDLWDSAITFYRGCAGDAE